MPRSWAPDGVCRALRIEYVHADELALTVGEDHLNLGGLLSGAVTYALVDYGMGATLWTRVEEDERIATINIAINYLQTARVGERVLCRTELDRRSRRLATMRSTVWGPDDRLMCTAIGSYAITAGRGPGPSS